MTLLKEAFKLCSCFNMNSIIMLNPTIQPRQDICNVGLAWSVNNLKVRKPIGEGLIFPHGQKALTSVNFSSLSPVSTFLFGGFENNPQ